MSPAFIKLICPSQLPQNFIAKNKLYLSLRFLFLWRFDPMRGQGLHLQALVITLIRHTHTQTHTHTHTHTLGRTRLDKRSDRSRGLYLTTHNTHNRQIFMHPAEFELTIPANERPQTHALDRAVTGTGIWFDIILTYKSHLLNYLILKILIKF